MPLALASVPSSPDGTDWHAAYLDRLAATGRWLAQRLGRETGSKVGKALATQ